MIFNILIQFITNLINAAVCSRPSTLHIPGWLMVAVLVYLQNPLKQLSTIYFSMVFGLTDTSVNFHFFNLTLCLKFTLLEVSSLHYMTQSSYFFVPLSWNARFPIFTFSQLFAVLFNKCLKSYSKYIPPLASHGYYGSASNHLKKDLLISIIIANNSFNCIQWLIDGVNCTSYLFLKKWWIQFCNTIKFLK